MSSSTGRAPRSAASSTSRSPSTRTTATMTTAAAAEVPPGRTGLAPVAAAPMEGSIDRRDPLSLQSCAVGLVDFGLNFCLYK
uniref:Uncharacterized protein LOC105049773 n=1 Tax=Elaeis guineensis var. tenera TaxID=51953 RepID=A0A6I9RSV6_ELAGV|nr:uncharacterized protein LOC105049773 [Elaeis guineensis]